MRELPDGASATPARAIAQVEIKPRAVSVIAPTANKTTYTARY
jgi:elongation factor P hydroxylase